MVLEIRDHAPVLLMSYHPITSTDLAGACFQALVAEPRWMQTGGYKLLLGVDQGPNVLLETTRWSTRTILC
jgi:hypothetical protein